MKQKIYSNPIEPIEDGLIEYKMSLSDKVVIIACIAGLLYFIFSVINSEFGMQMIHDLRNWIL